MLHVLFCPPSNTFVKKEVLAITRKQDKTFSYSLFAQKLGTRKHLDSYTPTGAPYPEIEGDHFATAKSLAKYQRSGLLVVSYSQVSKK